MTAKILGLPALSKTFRTLNFRQQRAAMTALLHAAAEPMRDRIESHVPIGARAPHLVDHIVISNVSSVEETEVRGKRRLDDSEFAVAVGPAKGWFYGDFLERGTVKMRAQPFMRPGFDEGQADALKIMQDGVFDVVEAAVHAAGGTGTL